MNEFDNIYHTDEYRRFMVQKEENISDLCREERTIRLDMGYSLWVGEFAHRSGSDCSYRCRLFSPEGKMIYGYTFYYSSFHETAVQVLSAPEGLYFFYTEGLYGYSVLRLSDMEQMHYVPRGNSGESFIITDLHYCSENRIAAAGGCFWAYPYDVALIDLSEPMKEPEKMTTLFPIVNPEHDYDRFEDIDFVRWEKGGRLIVRTDAGEEFAFNTNDLRKFMD
jgi:hypothetical protein